MDTQFHVLAIEPNWSYFIYYCLQFITGSTLRHIKCEFEQWHVVYKLGLCKHLIFLSCVCNFCFGMRNKNLHIVMLLLSHTCKWVMETWLKMIQTYGAEWIYWLMCCITKWIVNDTDFCFQFSPVKLCIHVSSLQCRSSHVISNFVTSSMIFTLQLIMLIVMLCSCRQWWIHVAKYNLIFSQMKDIINSIKRVLEKLKIIKIKRIKWIKLVSIYFL